MPKVGKITVQIPGRERKDYDLYYSQKDRFCIKGIPDDFIMLTGFRPEGYTTEAILWETLHVAIQTAREKLKSQRKVIVFKIAAATHLRMVKVGDGEYQGYRLGISKDIDEMPFGVPMCSMGLEYHIYIEVNDGIKKEYHTITGSDSFGRINGISSLFTIIDWTQEREDFFESIYESMSGLLRKLSTFFFSRDLETVLKAIDSKQLTLDK